MDVLAPRTPRAPRMALLAALGLCAAAGCERKPPPVCGDGIVNNDEVCDDGNTNDNDACRNDCTLAFCGDGVVNAAETISGGPAEECDDGNDDDRDACKRDCTLAFCGDGVVQDGVEECDDGNANDDDGCTNACTPSVCGDGVVQLGVEDCDDGDSDDANSCANDCTINYSLCSVAADVLAPPDLHLISYADATRFGAAVALGDGFVAVGAPYSQGSAPRTGAVYICAPRGDEWERLATLFAADGREGDEFGASVDLDGGTLAVGAPARGGGAVYVFAEDLEGGWTEQAALVADDGEALDHLGLTVALAGDLLVAGAPDDDDDDLGDASGAAYLFARPAADAPFVQVAKLRAEDGRAGALFGASVATDGAAVVIGAPRQMVAGKVDSGAAYLYVASDTDGWAAPSLAAHLVDPESAPYDRLGNAVAVAGDAVVVGLPGAADDKGYLYRGAALVFTRPPEATWAEVAPAARLLDPEGDARDFFGTTVAIRGDAGVIAVAAPRHEGAGDSSGA
ncbi:MAG: DUF4215 domain-containing protein, partial [Myxococcales bacterium]|nr:DUF4215 domain-containing protein [Myxococcales bacterium]